MQLEQLAEKHLFDIYKSFSEGKNHIQDDKFVASDLKKHLNFIIKKDKKLKIKAVFKIYKVLSIKKRNKNKITIEALVDNYWFFEEKKTSIPGELCEDNIIENSTLKFFLTYKQKKDQFILQSFSDDNGLFLDYHPGYEIKDRLDALNHYRNGIEWILLIFTAIWLQLTLPIIAILWLYKLFSKKLLFKKFSEHILSQIKRERTLFIFIICIDIVILWLVFYVWLQNR